MGTISKEELVRYNRQMMLPDIGLAGQEKLKAAKVLVIGAGGLGCPLLLYLSAAGVGSIGIIDFDTVELHNLHRQVLYSGEDVGKAKAVVAAEKLKIKNPNTNLFVYNEMLSETNAEKIISQFEIVVDGSDNFVTRYLVNEICVSLGIPLVYGSILRFEGQFAVFNYQGGKSLRDLFPEAPDPEDVPNCDETGVLGPLAGIIASMMAQETLKMIMGMNVLRNQLLLLDSKDWKYLRLDY